MTTTPPDNAHDVDDDDDDEFRPAFSDPRAVCVRWRVPPDLGGRTAVDVLAGKVRRLGTARAARVVAGGDLRVDDGTHQGRALALHEAVPRFTEVTLWRLPPDSLDDPMPTPTVLHDADGIIVVDKPGDLAMHPSARYLHTTLTGWLKRRGTPANPAHRLDRETSGVVVCARVGFLDVERRLKAAFANGRAAKEYLAVVRGRLQGACVVDAPLALQGERGLVRIRMIVDPAGQAACTEVEPVVIGTSRSLVRCRPRTGRQHQIRAHLAHLGHPIVGDKLYAMGDAWFDAFTRRALSDEQRASLEHPRQALHAARLHLLDEDRVFEAPFPDELRALVDVAST